MRSRIHIILVISMPFIKKLIAGFDADVEFASRLRGLCATSARRMLPVIVRSPAAGSNQEPGRD